MDIRRVLAVSLLALIITGCSALSALQTWLPVAVSAFDSFAVIASPGNTAIQAEAATVDSDFNTVIAAVKAAEAATGVAAKLQVVINDIPAFESMVASVATISPTDQEYIAAGATVIETAAQIYEAELSGNTVAELKNIKGICYGVEVAPDGSAKAYIDCTGDSTEAIYASIDPIPQTTTPKPAKTVTVTAKHAKLGNFKRQLNALAKKYNHPEKQMKLTLSEHLHVN